MSDALSFWHNKRVLITGNMGYIGPVVAAHFRHLYPDIDLTGFDTGFFAGCLVSPQVFPETLYNRQVFGDVRQFPVELLSGIDAVVHLAAISNDPMGKAFESVTEVINSQYAVEVARHAKQAGVRHFVLASSCSVYGFAEEGAKTEESGLNPLTAYARSKVSAEQGLRTLADEDFLVTCLRFGTACGWSPRLRLDLVLNDFVASAITRGTIIILSDGTPWRPMIHVRDMARAIEWGASRSRSAGGDCVTVNVGANHWNYQVIDLANAVRENMPHVTISVNPDAAPDKRSYRVDFSKFKQLAPEHQPQQTLSATVVDLIERLQNCNFNDDNFRESAFMRLKVLSDARSTHRLTEQLFWNH
jgi:nucleoside-diphosphate-sugar epimerase